MCVAPCSLCSSFCREIPWLRFRTGAVNTRVSLGSCIADPWLSRGCISLDNPRDIGMSLPVSA
jgi:hypothetical protein